MHTLRCARQLVSTASSAIRRSSSIASQPIRPLSCHNASCVPQLLHPSRDSRRPYSDETYSDDTKPWKTDRPKELKREPAVYYAPKPLNIEYAAELVTGYSKLIGRRILTAEETAEVYREFIPMTATIKPSPTDYQLEPKEIVILYKEASRSTPERILDELRRLVYSPNYTTTRNVGPHTRWSSEFKQEELGLFSKKLPDENTPMIKTHKNWNISKDGKGIERIFRFSKRLTAVGFVNGMEKMIKVKIDRSNRTLEHHPEYALSGRRVFVRWSTHEPQKGISGFDVWCAKQTERWAARCEVKDILPEIFTATFEIQPIVPGTADIVEGRLRELTTESAATTVGASDNNETAEEANSEPSREPTAEVNEEPSRESTAEVNEELSAEPTEALDAESIKKASDINGEATGSQEAKN